MNCVYVLRVNHTHIHGHYVYIYIQIVFGYYKQLCLPNYQPHTTVDMSTVLGSTKACLHSAVNHVQYVVNRKYGVAQIPIRTKTGQLRLQWDI